MDKGLKHTSPRQALLANQWDSVESEILAQKTVSQQQMQIDYHEKNGYKLPQRENADYLKQGDDEDADDKVYDSLEVESHYNAKRNLFPPYTEYMHTKIIQRESQLISNDDYSDLRYDPNWRINLKRNEDLINSPQISIEKFYTEEKFNQSYANRQELTINGGYRYIADSTPAVVVTPHTADCKSDWPYCLHLQGDQTSSVRSPDCHRNALQLGSQEAEISRPPSSSTTNESNNTLHSDSRETCEDSFDNAGHNNSTSTKMTENIPAAEFQTYHQSEWIQHIQGRPIETQKMSSPTMTSPNKKLKRLAEDIVERNKITLGRNTSRCGSYVRAHALKHEVPCHVNKVTQNSSGKKAQRKEYPNPSQQQQPSAPEVRSVQGDYLSSPLVRPTAVTQPKVQKMTSSQPVPSTIHLNINLNTSSHVLSLLQHTGQDALMNLASLCGHPQLSYASEVQIALPPKYQPTDLEKPSHMSLRRLNTKRHPHSNLESSPEQCQRTAALKLPLSSDGENQNFPNEVHSKQFPQNLLKTPIISSSQSLGSYTVLPPIEKPPTGKEHNLSPGQCVNTAYPIQRSSSDSYLSHMKKQKRLKAGVTYKEYSLKDYKQLNTVTNPQGLGPDYTTIAKTALEYAKTIAKPPLQSQPKQRQKHQSEGFAELVPYLEDLDISQLPTLELLRKRHEEEKQALANFRKVHAV
ncbi:jhy protein homolog [Channa argus]|uniref:jhy protein homolog n=1 Tax=Channa argus TaxID=215402 RepID=UPI0029473134|nr:hypothetical protein Q8A73_023710 [Channa argus]